MFCEITHEDPVGPGASVCAEEAAAVTPRTPASSGLPIDEATNVVATPAMIDAWMERAQPGDRFVYASRGYLPAGSAGGARMRELGKSGLVYLRQGRSSLDPSIFNYWAIRTESPSVLTRPVRPVLSAPAASVSIDEAAAIDVLLPVLERFAAKGRPCPTDKQLGERCGLPADAIAPTLEAMAAALLIRIQGARAPTYRRILILSTGAITGIAV